ncbi:MULTISPECIES: HalOD1 output domain-containing protein [Salinibaculum]|uniref:HalOD1 output domain-containing protein n=1 Tax=Salinibaculum TaxID=2732368 RepID=UPI0030D43A55
MTATTPEPRAAIEYRPEIDTYRVTFEHGSAPPSLVVPETMATVTETAVDDLDPLHAVIDPDALDALFQPRVKSAHRGDGEVIFEYLGHEVTVRSCGEILVQPLAESE